jgi:hypothetical protein
MSTKVRLIKLLEEVRDAGLPPLRRAPLKPAMLYLMELRSHTTEAHFASEKLIIPVDLQDSPDISHPVKITHLTPCEAPLALASAH